MDLKVAMKAFLEQNPEYITSTEGRKIAKVYEYVLTHAEEIWPGMLSQKLTMLTLLEAKLLYMEWLSNNVTFKTTFQKIFETFFGDIFESFMNTEMKEQIKEMIGEWPKAVKQQKKKFSENEMFIIRLELKPGDPLIDLINSNELTLEKLMEMRPGVMFFGKSY